MKSEEVIKIAIHCLGVLAEQEVCEECPVYRESGIVCKEVARTVISALKEIQQYQGIGTVDECKLAMEYWNYLRRQRCGVDGVVEKCMEYEQIGSIGECKMAVEKQIPKKPKEIDEEYGYFICGNCGGR